MTKKQLSVDLGWNRLNIVMCSEHGCKTTFPHPDPKHHGPCSRCWTRLKNKNRNRGNDD